MLVNLPFIILGAKTFNLRFAIKSIIAIVLLAIVVHLVNYPTITEDKLLIAVFGGFFLGLGIGLAMRGGCVIDGTEILSIFLKAEFLQILISGILKAILTHISSQAFSDAVS